MKLLLAPSLNGVNYDVRTVVVKIGLLMVSAVVPLAVVENNERENGMKCHQFETLHRSIYRLTRDSRESTAMDTCTVCFMFY
jgi:hypothetical protein